MRAAFHSLVPGHRRSGTPVDAAAGVPPVDAAAGVPPVDAAAGVPPVDAAAGVPLKRRTIALAVVLTVHLLLLLALVFLAPSPPGQRGRETTLQLREIAADRPAPAPAPAAATNRPAVVRRDTPRMPRPLVAVPRAEPKPALFGTELMEAVDITKLPDHSAERASAATESADAGTGNSSAPGDSVALSGSGGPHGEPLYRAEWVREPTDAELAFYLPKAGVPRGAWGTIACKTISRFHVDDCVELGEAPPGSGISRAWRQAAWQFLVRPPRIGGKALIGAWVSIRIDFTKTDAGQGG